jgi:hypothetical protein
MASNSNIIKPQPNAAAVPGAEVIHSGAVGQKSKPTSNDPPQGLPLRIPSELTSQAHPEFPRSCSYIQLPGPNTQSFLDVPKWFPFLKPGQRLTEGHFL